MNTIGVDSYIELYTMVWGWLQYNHLWEVLTDTGLVFLPFLGIILRNFVEPLQSQFARAASETSLARMQADLILMLLVVVMAGQPLITIETNELKFKQLCIATEQGFDSKEIKFGQGDSLFRNSSFAKVDDRAKVPVFWYAVMSFSSGLVYSLKEALPCVADVRLLRVEIDKARIVDPALRDEIKQFLVDCYYPSYTFLTLDKTQRLKHKDWTDAHEDLLAIERAKANPVGDLDSMGLFSPQLEIPANYLYSGRRASKPIAAYGIEPNEDDKRRGYKFGRPKCDAWWGTSNFKKSKFYQNSLSVRLKAHIKTNGMDLVSYFKKRMFGGAIGATVRFFTGASEEKLEHVAYVIASLYIINASFDMSRNRPLYKSQNEFMQGGSGSRTAIGKAWDKMFGLFGTFYEAMKVYPMVHITQQAAYAVQAMLLMAIFVVLPLGLVFSGFSHQFMIVAAMGIFTVKFFSYLFHVAWWLDRNLYLAVKGPAPDGTFEYIYDLFSNSPEEFKINLVTISLYFVFPGLAIIVFGWAGFQVMQGADALFAKMGGMGSAVAQAGKSGAQFGQKLIGQATNVASKAVGSKLGKAGRGGYFNKGGG